MPRAGTNDDVLRACRAVHEVPLAQRALLSLDDQEGFAGEHEEILLIGLPVVHRHGLARSKHGEVDAELREVGLALEPADRGAALGVAPPRLARVDDEPALALRDEAVLGRLELRLGNHERDRATPAPAGAWPLEPGRVCWIVLSDFR